MITLYADESGLRDAQREKVCVVTGFVGNDDNWGYFDQEWQRVLHEFDVRVFHGLEFWDWHLDAHRKVWRPAPYAGWTDEDDFDFVDSLLRVIEESKLFKVGAGIPLERFFELSEDERRWMTTSALFDKDWGQKGKPNDPWFAAFQSTIISAGSTVPDGDKLCPIFDRRDSPTQKKKPNEDKARQLYAEILDQPLQMRSRLGESISFGNKAEHRGLQAADLLANRSRVYIAEGLGRDKLSNRLREFLEKGSGFTKMLGIRGLDLLLRACPFRQTFWKVEEFKTAEPDYLEHMRREANVVAYKSIKDAQYFSHHIRPERVKKIQRIGVSGDLVYIASPDSSIQQAKDPESDTRK